jgi:hypothetical protein
MQSQPAPSYTYDATGHLVTTIPNGASSDVVRAVTVPTVALPVAQSFTSSGLFHPTVLNASHLFTPAISVTNPPVRVLPAASQAAPGTIIATKRPFLAPEDTTLRR